MVHTLIKIDFVKILALPPPPGCKTATLENCATVKKSIPQDFDDDNMVTLSAQVEIFWQVGAT